MRPALALCLTLIIALSPLPSPAGSPVQNLGPEVKSALNAIRAKNGLGALTVNDRLTAAAAAHLRNMIKFGFFKHRGPGRSTPGSRARKQGYRYCVIAENIAKGQRSVDEVLRSWMSSPGHRKNILHTGVTEFSLVHGADNLWVMVLGRSGC